MMPALKLSPAPMVLTASNGGMEYSLEIVPVRNEKKVIEYNSSMSKQADFIVDEAFTKAMADELGKREFTITMLLSPDTGKVMEVNFNFTTFSPYARVPLHVYREIEVKLKEQIHFKPGEVGKQLNYIMLSWRQKPQGKLPPLPPPGSLM
jgi:hypothetical protein